MGFSLSKYTFFYSHALVGTFYNYMPNEMHRDELCL